MKEFFQPSNACTSVFCKGLQRYLWQQNWHSCTVQGARIWESSAVSAHPLNGTHRGFLVQQNNRGGGVTLRIDRGKREREQSQSIHCCINLPILCSMTGVHEGMESYSSHTQCICPLSSPSIRAGCCNEHLALTAELISSLTKRNFYYAQQDPLKCK